MLRAHVLFLILIFAFGSAWSNDINKPIDQTKTAKQSANADKQGTKQNPFIIKVDATKKSKAESDEDQSDKLEHSHNESLIAYGTIALAIITLILACATIILAAFTYKLWKATIKLAEETERNSARQAKKMRKALAISQESADAAKKSAEVAESTVRPFLYWGTLVGYNLHPSIGICNDYTGYETTYTPIISISIKNLGGTPALIKEHLYKISLVDSIPSIPDFSGNEVRLGSKKAIGSKDETPVEEIQGCQITLPDKEWISSVYNGDKFFIFIGYVKYSDFFGNEHIWGWGLSYKDGELKEIGGESYNYQT